MQEVVKLILHVQETLNMYGKFQVLCYLALIYLFFENKKSDRRVFLYSVIALLLLWNPPVISFLIRQFPEVSAYWELLWIFPIFIPIAYAGTILLMDWKETAKKQVWMGYLLGFLAVIALSGSVWPYASDTVERTENLYGIPTSEMEALEVLTQEEGAIKLLAPGRLLQAARLYDGSIITAYGRNLWSSSVPNTTLDSYSEEQRSLYALMEAPTGNEEMITREAAEMGCNYLVVSNGKREQEEFVNPTRDPNQIPDLSVSSLTYEVNGYKHVATTEYYHILKKEA